VARRNSHVFRTFLARFTLPLLIAASTAGLSSASLLAQEPTPIPFQGYITAVHPSGTFDVDGKHVVTTPETVYGIMGGKTPRMNSPLQDRLQPGAWVQVTDDRYKNTKAAKAAATILIRDDWDQKLSGLGVIAKVISSGQQPVFEADGYRIRITPATITSFAGSLKSLADVGTNIWLRYEGRRDRNGVLVAAKAQFIQAKPPKLKPLKHWEEDSDFQFRPPSSGPKPSPTPKGSVPPFVDYPKDDAVLTQDGGIRWGMLGGLHKIPADNALQARIRRVGMSLVPAYQRQLPADDPAKIPFHFYAVDARNFRCDLIPFDGLILIPTQAVDRLKNDDQLAAVLADGLAGELQRQGARAASDNRILASAYLAGDVAEAFIPGMSLVTLAGGATVATKVTIELAEQRARMALALMADAGYDPWQAPEAWRLLVPKKLPKDLSKLKYPDFSCYELGILNLQYKSAKARPSAPAVTASAQTAQP